MQNYILNPSKPRRKNSHTKPGGGGGSIGHPSTFDTIHPIDMKLGTYNKLHLYFQLSGTKWCLIGFHGNNRHHRRPPSWIFKFSDFD